MQGDHGQPGYYQYPQYAADRPPLPEDPPPLPSTIQQETAGWQGQQQPSHQAQPWTDPAHQQSAGDPSQQGWGTQGQYHQQYSHASYTQAATGHQGEYDQTAGTSQAPWHTPPPPAPPDTTEWRSAEQQPGWQSEPEPPLPPQPLSDQDPTAGGFKWSSQAGYASQQYPSQRYPSQPVAGPSRWDDPVPQGGGAGGPRWEELEQGLPPPPAPAESGRSRWAERSEVPHAPPPDVRRPERSRWEEAEPAALSSPQQSAHAQTPGGEQGA